MMISDELLKRHNVSEEKKLYLSSWILQDYSLLKTLLTYAGNCETQNPYYKFIEICERVQSCDRVYIHDLETLDEYYKMGLVKKLLNDYELCEYYTGGAFKEKRRLANHLKREFNRFDYNAFHSFLAGLA